MKDLEIRGAGNLLGPEQSGQIGCVGYDLYMEMLEQAMAELRGQPVEDALDPEIRLPVPALLPESYVEEVSQRLVLYKQLSAARDETELREVLDDLLDRFGPLPLEARNLADVIRLKIRCRTLGIEGVDTSGDELRLRAGARTRIDPSLLVRLLGRPKTPIRVTPDQCIFMRIRKPEDALAEAQSLLELLTPAASGGRPAQGTEASAAGKGRGEAR
jgi:transcription-repair coupling factor (superfamily II helicase)